MQEKKELRKYIKALKKQLTDDDRHAQAVIVHQQLEQTGIFKRAKAILFYWAMPDEIPTRAFINKWYLQKEIYLPVINGNDLKIVRYEGEHSLVPGDKYGIPEPNGKEIDDENRIEVVVVPGVAFDSNNNRIGRGAGYYDRILNRITGAIKVALAFDFQMVSHVPVEPHDIKMDIVLSK